MKVNSKDVSYVQSKLLIFFNFFPIEIEGILVCRGLLHDNELDFTDVFIVGIGFLLSTVKLFLGMKVGNFFVVVGVI